MNISLYLAVNKVLRARSLAVEYPTDNIKKSVSDRVVAGSIPAGPIFILLISIIFMAKYLTRPEIEKLRNLQGREKTNYKKELALLRLNRKYGTALKKPVEFFELAQEGEVEASLRRGFMHFKLPNAGRMGRFVFPLEENGKRLVTPLLAEGKIFTARYDATMERIYLFEANEIRVGNDYMVTGSRIIPKQFVDCRWYEMGHLAYPFLKKEMLPCPC